MIARNSQFINAQQVGVVAPFTPTFLEVILGAFSYAHSDVIPTLRAEFPFENDGPFTIRRPVPAEITENGSFGLAVRYLADNGDLIRYALFKPYLMDGLLYPDYEGQKLGASAILELWSMPGESPIAADGFTLYAGPLKFLTSGQFCYCGPIAADTTTLTGTAV